MCSFREFAMACDEGKPLAWINMMGDPPNHKPDENTVRIALPGLIYHKWDPAHVKDESAVEWAMLKLVGLCPGKRAYERGTGVGKQHEHEVQNPLQHFEATNPGADAMRE